MNAHGSQSARYCDTICRVAVTDEVARCRVRRKCFGDLSGDPIGGWMCGHIGLDEPSALQTQDDQPVEEFEPDCRDYEQINGSDMDGVVAQEGSPAR